MTKENAIKFVTNLFTDVWTNLDATQVDKFYHSDVIGQINDQKVAYKDIFNRINYIKTHTKAFASKVQDILVDADKIIVRVEQTAAWKEKTGAEKFNFIAIYRMRDNKAAEMWSCVNPGIDYFAK